MLRCSIRVMRKTVSHRGYVCFLHTSGGPAGLAMPDTPPLRPPGGDKIADASSFACATRGAGPGRTARSRALAGRWLPSCSMSPGEGSDAAAGYYRRSGHLSEHGAKRVARPHQNARGAQPARAIGRHRFDHLRPWLDCDNSAASGTHRTLKRHQIREFGYADRHLVPLGLGGLPRIRATYGPSRGCRWMVCRLERRTGGGPGATWVFAVGCRWLMPGALAADWIAAHRRYVIGTQ